MKFSAVILPLMPALAWAQINYCAGDKNTVGHCTTTSYTDLTGSSPSPPTTGECQDTCRGVFGDAGDWIADLTNAPVGQKHTMLIYPCAFSYSRSPNEATGKKFFMDNQDIADIIDEVNKRFGPLHSGRVAATGTMICDGYEAIWWVD